MTEVTNLNGFGIKGSGTQDYYCDKVVRFDRPWSGESPADIHNFLNCPFNFILN
jgi:hypothetical protein